MASLSLCSQFETNLMSNRKVIQLLLQLKSAKAHDKNYIKVKPHLARHLMRNCLLVKHNRSDHFLSLMKGTVFDVMSFLAEIKVTSRLDSKIT